jgi:hypothetical protein
MPQPPVQISVRGRCGFLTGLGRKSVLEPCLVPVWVPYPRGAQARGKSGLIWNLELCVAVIALEYDRETLPLVCAVSAKCAEALVQQHTKKNPKVTRYVWQQA